MGAVRSETDRGKLKCEAHGRVLSLPNLKIINDDETIGYQRLNIEFQDSNMDGGEAQIPYRGMVVSVTKEGEHKIIKPPLFSPPWRHR